jgi:hypothetical protein
MSRTASKSRLRPGPKRSASTTRRKAAPRSVEAPKAKVSIAVDPAALSWATELARARGTSLSAVMGDALEQLRRQVNLSKLLAALGGTDDISEEERAQFAAERRAAGLSW